MKRITLLLTVLCALAFSVSSDAATLQICNQVSKSTGTCTGTWLTLTGSTDFCGADNMSDGNHVFVGDKIDTNGNEQGIVNCEIALHRPVGYIYAAVAGSNNSCSHSDAITSAVSMCEYYPYYDCEADTGSCFYTESESDGPTPDDEDQSGNQLDCYWERYIVQGTDFGWPAYSFGSFPTVDMPPPSQDQHNHIWNKAVGCIPTGQTRSIGVL